MFNMLGTFMAAMAGIALVTGVASGASLEEFYKGKTLRFVVGFSAGGGFDTYSRLIARHIGKHIPGHPTTIVQNMPGAGGMIAANYVYNKAKPDGLTIGNFIGSLILQQVLGNKAAMFDGRKLGWLGIPDPDHQVCALTSQSGVTRLEEWFASKRPIKIGATAPGATTADLPKLLRAALRLPIQVIEGYGGSSRIRLAAESGEVDGGCWSWGSMKSTWTRALAAGEVRIIIQTMLESHPDLKDVPLAIDQAKTDEARELMKLADGAYGVTTRPYSTPPGIPDDRLKLLQKAFSDTMKDPELLEQARRSKLAIRPVDGPRTGQYFAALYDLEPSLLAKLKEIVLPKK